MMNLWNLNALIKLMNAIGDISPKWEDPITTLTRDGNTGNFEYKVYTLFGWLKLRAVSYGQKSVTTNALVKAQIELGEKAFVFFNSNGEFDWRYDFEADGFSLEFQMAVKELVERQLLGEGE